MQRWCAIVLVLIVSLALGATGASLKSGVVEIGGGDYGARCQATNVSGAPVDITLRMYDETGALRVATPTTSVLPGKSISLYLWGNGPRRCVADTSGTADSIRMNTYRANSPHGSEDVAPGLLLNSPPVANPDTSTTDEDTPLAVPDGPSDVLANDSDPDGDPITVTAYDVTSALGAAVTVAGDGSYSYDPTGLAVFQALNVGDSLDDTFGYTIDDGNGGTASSTVTVTVTGVDDAPVAVDDTKTVTEDDPATAIDVLANDPDVDGGTKLVDTVTQPPNGTVVITGGGTGLTYEPDPNACNDGVPTDDFTYTLTPGGDTATVEVTVTCVDDAPVAVDDTKTVTEDDPATAIDVLANDSDVEGDPFSIDTVTQPPDGTVVITGGGTGLTYEPDPNACNDGVPTDDFSYTLTPGGDTATVEVTVTCVDDAPVAVDDTKTVTEDDPATPIDVLANDPDVDGGTKLVDTVTQPPDGSVVITGGGTGLTYQPDPNYCNDPPGTSTDDFTYTLTPGGDTATVEVTVTCVDDAPVAVDDTKTVTEDDPATAIDVLANDTDVDGGTKLVDTVTQPPAGTVVITGGGTGLTYEPDPNACNDGVPTDDFTYTLTPGGDTATVEVTVTCVDDAPVAVDDTKTVTEDDPATAIDVLANDTDVDGGTKLVDTVTQPPAGTVVITGGGTGLTYEPDPNACNDGVPTDDFTYTLTPGGDTATVEVTVTCVDDAPMAVDDTKTVTEDDPATAIDVLANDNDEEGDPFSIDTVTQPPNGTVVITGGGTGLTYQPDPDACNDGVPTDDFTYTLTPGGDTATVEVTVTCVNDEPSFTASNPPASNEDAGLQTVAGWASFDPGPANEGGQTATYMVSGLTNPTLLASGPAIDAAGQLTYTAAANKWGSATFDVKVVDSGGTAGGGDDTSPTQNFTITVNPVNDPPTAAANPPGGGYTAAANIQISFSATNGLLTNSADHPSEGTAVSFDGTGVITTTQGGNVVVNTTTGAFSYDPPAGYVGADDFSYTVTDSGIPGSATSAAATVNLTVAGPVIWFVDVADTMAGGDGRLSDPFQCLVGAGCFAPVSSGGATGDYIHLADGSYTGGLTLLSGQTLIGDGSSSNLGSLTGVSPPSGSLSLPVFSGTDPVLNSGTNGITIGTNNGVRGLSIGNTGGAGLNGTAAGTLEVTELTVNGTGDGVDLTGGGTMNFNGAVSLSTGASTAFSVTGGGTLNLTTTNGANDVTTTTGTAVEISGGTLIGGLGVTFESIDSPSASANTAIILADTGAGSFSVAGAGGLCETGTLTCTGGEIANKTVDAVTLLRTGGRVTLTRMLIHDIGDMGGGFNTRSQDDAIHGETVSGGLTLDTVVIRRISDMCVNGATFGGPFPGLGATTWDGLDILDSTIEDCNRWHVTGTGDTSDEGGVRIVGLTGIVTVDNSLVQRAGELFDLFTDDIGTLTMTVTNSDFIDAFKEFTSGGTVAIGKSCLDVTVEGDSDANVFIGGSGVGNEFINCGTSSFRVGKDTTPAGTSDIDVVVDDNIFRVTDQTPANDVFGNTPQGGVALRAGPGGITTFDAVVSNNTFGVAIGPDDDIASTTDEVGNADGVEGNLALIFESGVGNARVNDNTFNGPLNAPWFNRGDGNTSAAVLYEDNNYRGRGDYCCDPPPSGTFRVPGIPSRTRVRNGGSLDITFINESMAVHDQAFFAQTETMEFESTSVGGGGTMCVALDSVISPDGIEFDEDAGAISLYQGAVNNAAVGPCGVVADPHATSTDCELELADDGVRGGPVGYDAGTGAPDATLNPPYVDVDGGSIAITGTACTLPPTTGIFAP